MLDCIHCIIMPLLLLCYRDIGGIKYSLNQHEAITSGTIYHRTNHHTHTCIHVNEYIHAVHVMVRPPTPYHFHVGHQRLSVHVPLAPELRGRGVFAAAQLHGDLQTVPVEVVEVLHPS